jgi:hypothetical protein
MSLGGGISTTLDNAVGRSIDDGVSYGRGRQRVGLLDP